MLRIEAEKFLDTEYPIDIRGRLYPILDTAAETVNQLVKEREPAFFSGPLFKAVYGRLFTYAIARQFTPEYLPNTIKLNSEIQKVNNFGFLVPRICADNSYLYVHKVRNIDNVPAPKYLSCVAQYNGNYEEQLMIRDFENPDKLSSSPRCVLLVYSSRNNSSIDSARLVYPDSELKTQIALFDLKSEMKNYYNDEIVHTYREKTITGLKEEVMSEYSKKLEVVNNAQ